MPYSKILFIAILLLFSPKIGAKLYAQEPPCRCKYSPPFEKLSFKKLGQSYQYLAKIRLCSRYNSDLHQLMDEFLSRVKTKSIAPKKIKKYFGKPLYTQLPDPYDSIYKTKEGDEVWIYPWRGLHDFLYIVIRDNKVIHIDWFMAYE